MMKSLLTATEMNLTSVNLSPRSMLMILMNRRGGAVELISIADFLSFIRLTGREVGNNSHA